MRHRLLLAALMAVFAVPTMAAAEGGLDTTISSGPASLVASNTATFVFTANDPAATFSCKLDNAAFKACTSPLTLTNLPDGQHTLLVAARKDKDRDHSPASWTWTVDTTPPAAPVGAHAAVSYRRLVLSWAASADTDHVVVLRGTSAKKAASSQVYSGPATSYTEPKFVNATYHRYSITSYDKAGNQSPALQVDVPASALLLAPADRATVRAHKPQIFSWRAVPKARYYNIQLWRAGHKILTAWPRRPRLRLAASWKSRGHRYSLKRGAYTWFVWPGFGPLAKGRYGELAGKATFKAG